MLKTVLYVLLLLTTAIRFADVVYLLTGETTNLPIAVLAVTSATVLYGVVLLVRRFIGSVRLKHFLMFFIVQSAAFIFNLIFVMATVPVKITTLETVAVGTLLDVIINCAAIYYCVRSMRSKKFMTVGHM